MTHSAQLDARLRPHPRARVRRADEESRLAHGFPDASFEFSQRALAFSPDGARLLWTTSRAPYAQTAAAGSGRGATLGDAARGSAPGRHSGQAVSAALSPDGRFVVTGGADRLALLWELVQAPAPPPGRRRCVPRAERRGAGRGRGRARVAAREAARGAAGRAGLRRGLGARLRRQRRPLARRRPRPTPQAPSPPSGRLGPTAPPRPPARGTGRRAGRRSPRTSVSCSWSPPARNP